MASQPSFLLADLLDTSSMRLLYGSSSCPVQQVVADSRHVVPGALFVAVRGHRVDGHDFLGDVLDRGANTLVVEALPQALQARVEREGERGRPCFDHETFVPHPADSRRMCGRVERPTTVCNDSHRQRFPAVPVCRAVAAREPQRSPALVSSIGRSPPRVERRPP